MKVVRAVINGKPAESSVVRANPRASCLSSSALPGREMAAAAARREIVLGGYMMWGDGREPSWA